MNFNDNNRFTGNKIRSYRKKMKLTQEELANRIGVKGNSISAYERGGVEIPNSKLQALANVFDITTLDLLPIEGTENNDSISAYVQEAKSELTDDQLKFVEDILKKALSLSGSERSDLFKNIKLAVKFFEEN